LEKLRQFEKLKKEGEVEAYHDESLSDAVLALNVNLQARERGNVLFKENKYAEGVKEYTEAIKRNRKDPRNLSNRAACYIKLLALPEADKDCDDAIKIDPTFMKSYIRKASIQFAKKDYKKTIDICNDALLKDTEKKHTAEIEDQVCACCLWR
jgi:stress-induced-phosphoprotein 1